MEHYLITEDGVDSRCRKDCGLSYRGTVYIHLKTMGSPKKDRTKEGQKENKETSKQ